MDVAKYVAMLQQEALYFSRVDQLGDPYEGSLSKDEYERLEATAAQGEAVGPLPPGWRGHYFEILMRNTRVARRSNYVSCWHLGDQESDAMWRVYSESGFAVVIQSTYARLVNALPGEGADTCCVGLVSYTDHRTEAMPGGNAFYPIMHKRRAFVHEHEVRAVVSRGDPWIGRAESRSSRNCRRISRSIQHPFSAFKTLTISSTFDGCSCRRSPGFTPRDTILLRRHADRAAGQIARDPGVV